MNRWPLISLLVLAVPWHQSRADKGQNLIVQGRDSAAIMTAIEKSAPGDTVSLPAGVYEISKTIVVNKSGIRLIGAGQEKTILRFTGKSPSSILRLSNCENIEVNGMTLDGDENVNATAGIGGSNSRKLLIHFLAIKNLVKNQNFGPHGIYFTGNNPTAEKGVTDSEISDCVIENIGIGAQFGGGIRLSWGSSRNQVLRNTIRKTGRGGIFADNRSTDLVIRNNVVNSSGGAGLGIEVWGGCHRALIEDNSIDHWLSFDSSDYGAARRNIISDKSGTYKHAGIELVGSSFCVFTDNTVDDGQRIGISMSNKPPKNYVYWGFNKIQRCNEWGAQLQGEAGGIAYHYFYRCQFVGTTVGRGEPRYPKDDGRGFRTNGDVRHVTFEECEFRGNERSGIQLGGPNVDFLSFVRCKIQGNKGSAVSGPSNYTALEWTQCLVTGNGTNTLPAARPFPTKPPIVKIAAPKAARVGEAVQFGISSTVRGNIRQVLWDFNDGVPHTEPSASHTYQKAGVHRVTLLAWDSAGRGARAEINLNVSP